VENVKVAEWMQGTNQIGDYKDGAKNCVRKKHEKKKFIRKSEFVNVELLGNQLNYYS